MMTEDRCHLLFPGGLEPAVGAAEAQQRLAIDNSAVVDAVAGQGVHHIQELIAALLHRTVATAAGNPAAETEGTSLPPQPPAVTGPMQSSPCSRRQRIRLSGSCGS
jgi:hypothetical protein